VNIAAYLSGLRKSLARGDATEHTHRPALKTLLESASKGIVATNEPKRIACGAPDFIITRKATPLGHVETKDVGTCLDEIERGRADGEQFKRYIDGLPSWILTDYLEFRWYVNGEKRHTVHLGSLEGKRKINEAPDGGAELAHLLDVFLTAPALTVENAKDLAKRMAGMTQILRSQIAATFEHGSVQDRKQLENWIKAFREVLIPDLNEHQFADMFAQTLAYGLFAARVHSLDSDKPFSREMAAYNLPKTNPFLRKLFAEIAGVDMPDTFGWAVDDLVFLLNHANWEKVLADFGKGMARHDPVVHFYETFLAAYDPTVRELRGVYYTPEPVVSYIVRSVDHLLKTNFKKPKGLADEKTLILDPAVGTATFLFFVIEQIYARFAKQKGAWDAYVADHLLERVFGFELLMAPYAVAHLKLGMELQKTGYKFGSDQRLGIYLTNTLEEAAKKSHELFAQWISEEANAAAEIKRTRPILVVLGNPPYSGHSANRSHWERTVAPGQTYTVVKGGPARSQQVVVTKTAKKRTTIKERTFIGNLLTDYYYVDDMPLGEKNSKWLQDDYVKFIRFAQWRLETTGDGILGFVTNHGYLDNPTFRGMRQSLMRSFSHLYVYDLHGNSKKGEIAPSGGEDKNVFDIQQGVAIILAVKEPAHIGLGKVFHADLWGSREHKYDVLSETDVSGTKWKALNPSTPDYYFIPQEIDLKSEYELGWRLTDAMPVNATGFQTHRDAFAIAFDKETIVNRIERLRGVEDSDEDLAEEFGLRDTGGWTLAEARTALRTNENWEAAFLKCLYRPFDWRWCHFDYATIDRPRRELLDSMAGKENLALNVTRQTRAATWQHALVSDVPAPALAVELKDGSNLFLLYLYPDPKQRSFLAERRSNFSEKFIADLKLKLKLEWKDSGKGDLRKTIGPEDVFYYAYAVFHSHGYCSRYVEFLKRDFPRFPITTRVKTFAELSRIGRELVSVHLMKSDHLDEFITEFPVRGDNAIEEVKYLPEKQHVRINAAQYFGSVPQTIWDSMIGGYQPCQKWLEDRKGRKLTYDDIQHWQRIVVAVKETTKLAKEIDAVIPGWPLL
jgi:predicted helicase